MVVQKLEEQRKIVDKFAFAGTVTDMAEYGSGHINATYKLEADDNGTPRKYIFQQINTDIFKNADELMENIEGVTSFLTEKIKARGGDIDRETLRVIPTKDGKSFYRDEEGRCYRMYLFVRDAYGMDVVKGVADFYESAVAFGNFQYLLSEYPADTLHETIPDFHNTKKRFETFCEAVKADVCGRAAAVQKEIEFVMERAEEMDCLTKRIESGELPLRVTHNDTKSNNILIDDETRKAVCIIDLDTVMPGLSLYDFGDSIRFGANNAAEDEPDYTKATINLEFFEAYVKGYLEGSKGSLTENEIRLLPVGAKMMTLECGMRFLTDYLQGDTYFKIHRENHNLDRCHTQFGLVKSMEDNWQAMQDIVKKYY